MWVLTKCCPAMVPPFRGPSGSHHDNRHHSDRDRKKRGGDKVLGTQGNSAVPLPAEWLCSVAEAEVTMKMATRVRQGTSPDVWNGLLSLPAHRQRQAFGVNIPDAPCQPTKSPLVNMLDTSLDLVLKTLKEHSDDAPKQGTRWKRPSDFAQWSQDAN